ncbi:hypothetical protein BLJAPNOD_05281 [Ensifer sp. M14]|nr:MULTISPECIES: DUF4087 domain-containing protein [Sinorhizobium/Ensifer group]RDL48054.1 hypothetical protein BLJAPNOD_05281 [Ensifer sp. M14]
MKILASFSLASILCPFAALTERRCGWLNNPSTADWALNDADGS